MVLSYNQSLVRRGEILLGFDVIDNWHAELKEMNKDKVGEPFHYPDTFLLLLRYAKEYFHLAIIDKLKRVVHKDMLKENYLLFLTILQ